MKSSPISQPLHQRARNNVDRRGVGGGKKIRRKEKNTGSYRRKEGQGKGNYSHLFLVFAKFKKVYLRGRVLQGKDMKGKNENRTGVGGLSAECRFKT